MPEPLAYTTTPHSPAPLIPSAETVRIRLLELCRQVRLLRRQLRVSQAAAEQVATPAARKAVANG